MARKGVSPEVNALSVLITVVLGTLILVADRMERRSAAKLNK
jgi:ABC-type spermidine/putrescine transport system permease subunit II